MVAMQKRQKSFQLNGQLLCCLSQHLLPASGSGSVYHGIACSLGKVSVCQKFGLKLNQNNVTHELSICHSLSHIIHCRLHLCVCVHVCVVRNLHSNSFHGTSGCRDHFIGYPGDTLNLQFYNAAMEYHHKAFTAPNPG